MLAHTDLKRLWAALQNGKTAIWIHSMDKDKPVIFIFYFCLSLISYVVKSKYFFFQLLTLF